jgi:phosphomannomutase
MADADRLLRRYHLRTGCCVAVTGSHNPPDYNGFKMVVGGETLSTATRSRPVRAHRRGPPAPRAGRAAQQRDILADYIQRIAGDVQLARRAEGRVDCGNGVAGAIAPDPARGDRLRTSSSCTARSTALPQPPSRPERSRTTSST